MRLAAAALRNYVSPILVRDNPYFIMTCVYLLALPLTAWQWKANAAQGIEEFLSHPKHLTTFSLLTWFLPSCLVWHYWRQVRADIAPAIPAFIAAERNAVMVMLTASTIMLTAPLVWCGAPVLGSLALVSIAMVIGGAMGTAAPTGISTGLRLVRSAILLPLMVASFIPHAVQRLVFAPPPLAALLSAVALGLTVSGLLYRPARAGAQADREAHAQDRIPVPVRRGRLMALLMWRPDFMPELPLPSAFGQRFGPIGVMLATLVPMAMLLGFLALVDQLTDATPYLQALRATAPAALSSGLAIGLVSGGRWLMVRDDWALLFCAGRYGGRLDFSRAMFAAHRQTLLIIAPTAGCFAAVVAAATGHVAWMSVPILAASLCAMLFGASYTVSVPLLWREFGGKGVTFACNIGAFFLVDSASTLLLGSRSVRIVGAGIAISVAVSGFGAIMSRIAPKRLATMDWPLESDAAPDI